MFKLLRKLKSLLFSRIVIVGALIMLQIAIILLFILRLSEYFVALYGVFLLISLLVMLYVINKDDNPSYKLAWSIPILLFPLFGGLFYLLLGTKHLNNALVTRMSGARAKLEPILRQDETVLQKLEVLNGEAYRQSCYISRAGYSIYENTDTTYFPVGEAKFEAMCRELENAKRFILMEYFIIEEGFMWSTILEILERKAKEGVEVRVMYDSFGCLFTLPDGYFRKLREKGIQCIEFNPLIPIMTMVMNNRDHRKILVIDGHTGFMGGINLADEYINRKPKHGHWKDSAVMLHGDAVVALTTMFLSMWEGVSGQPENYQKYLPRQEELHVGPNNGFVQPYSDSPLDNELVGEYTYLNMINRAKKYVYITSPYLIIDNELITALTLAAKSGVDVRIVTPHIGDKWYAYMATRAYYQQLVAGGVKIYEYTPGFIHAKSFVVDDEIATVGTVNLDYRSLYLHFECGVWMYKTSAVDVMREDFIKMMEVCTPIAIDSAVIQAGGVQKLIRAILRVFAPLM